MYQLIIIDDEEKILEGISELFPWNQIGFEVAGTFTQASAALDYMEDHPIDVVMTDIQMPDMDGLELTRRLQERELEVVIFSSYSDYKYMREALQLEVSDYLLKPVSYSELLSTFEKVKGRLDSKHAVETEREGSYYEKIIEQSDAYLMEHYKTACLNDAAEQVGISAGYLSRIYREHKGIGFQETLTRIRMEKAGEMLMNPAYKSYEIAFYVGYDNPKNFTRAFKAYYQVTPREYRNGVRAGEEPK